MPDATTGAACEAELPEVPGAVRGTTKGKYQNAKVACQRYGKGAEYSNRNRNKWANRLLSNMEARMSLIQKLLASLQHRTENTAKYDENLRAEDGFVRPGQKGFLRLY